MRKVLLGIFSLLLCTAAHAGVLTTTWAADGSEDGTGTGTLGSNTLTYFTVSGAGNAGITIANIFWDSSLATVAAGPYSDQSAGVLGVDGSSTNVQAQTIQFSAAIVDPLILINYSDEGTSLDFGSLLLTLLGSNNAQLTGSVVTFTGSTNTVDDGFVARINGSFGPGTPLTFNYGTTNETFDSVAFSIGESGVPEPATLTLSVFALAALGIARRRIAARA
jgi:hypothetical protein